MKDDSSADGLTRPFTAADKQPPPGRVLLLVSAASRLHSQPCFTLTTNFKLTFQAYRGQHQLSNRRTGTEVSQLAEPMWIRQFQEQRNKQQNCCEMMS